MTNRIPAVSLDVRPMLAAIDYATARVDLDDGGGYLAMRTASLGVVSIWVDSAGVVRVPGLAHGEWTTCHSLTASEESGARTAVDLERKRAAAVNTARQAEHAEGGAALSDAIAVLGRHLADAAAAALRRGALLETVAAACIAARPARRTRTSSCWEPCGWQWLEVAQADDWAALETAIGVSLSVSERTGLSTAAFREALLRLADASPLCLTPAIAW